MVTTCNLSQGRRPEFNQKRGGYRVNGALDLVECHSKEYKSNGAQMAHHKATEVPNRVVAVFTIVKKFPIPLPSKGLPKLNFPPRNINLHLHLEML